MSLPGTERLASSASASFDVAVEHSREVRDDGSLDVGHRDVAAEQRRQRGHAAIGDPARHDQVETGEVGGDVEGEAVARHPARDADADGGELHVAYPGAAEAFHASGCDPEVRGGANQHFLEIADVAVDVLAIRLEVDDRIADQLPGTVEGDVAATPGLVDRDALRR